MITPEFWIDVQKKLEFPVEEFDKVEFILCALGFMTKSSIRMLGIKEILCELEEQYTMIRSNEAKFNIL